LLSAGTAMQSGQVEDALGDDLSAVDFGKGNQSPGGRDINRTAKDGSVPSAHENGLAPLEPRRVCLADGQGRDVVQRGLNRQKGFGEV
jgi:hypothetical protein